MACHVIFKLFFFFSMFAIILHSLYIFMQFFDIFVKFMFINFYDYDYFSHLTLRVAGQTNCEMSKAVKTQERKNVT